jgi:hypothetical protein
MLTELFAAPETVEDMVIEKRKVTSTGCEPWLYSSVVADGAYGLEQALRVPGGWGSQISRQSAHERQEVQHFLTFEDWASTLSRNVDTELPLNAT